MPGGSGLPDVKEDVQIRSMEKEDLSAVAELEAELFSPPWKEKNFAYYLEQPYAVFLVAVDLSKGGEALIGYAGALLVGDEAEITHVAVAGGKEGHGIGSALLKDLLDRTKQARANSVFLEVRKSNQRAIALYRKSGFSVYGERRNYYEKPTEDALLMRREEEE